MKFRVRIIDDILSYRSVAIVGMAKNVGKTVTLNYLLDGLKETGKRIGVTSIGLDGEGLDQVTTTPKPEITLYNGMTFTTAEQQYAGRELTAEILSVGGRMTSVGRLVTARVVVPGKVMITGPADTYSLSKLLKEYRESQVDLALVDGALSRLSPASPTVTDALVLATGAAVSANIAQVVKSTKYACQLIELPETESQVRERLLNCERGVWVLRKDGTLEKTKVLSALAGEIPAIDDSVRAIYASGAVGNLFVERLRNQRKEIELVVGDFTKIFVTQDCYAMTLRSKVRMSVLYKSKLAAVTANPWSPQGYTFDSDELCDRLRDEINVGVFDVKRI